MKLVIHILVCTVSSATETFVSHVFICIKTKRFVCFLGQLLKRYYEKVSSLIFSTFKCLLYLDFIYYFVILMCIW